MQVTVPTWIQLDQSPSETKNTKIETKECITTQTDLNL